MGETRQIVPVFPLLIKKVTSYRAAAVRKSAKTCCGALRWRKFAKFPESGHICILLPDKWIVGGGGGLGGRLIPN